MSNEYERRFLAQHNRSRSPPLRGCGRAGLQTTPVKAGDRFIPLRAHSREWRTRFAAGQPETAKPDNEQPPPPAALHRSASWLSMFSETSLASVGANESQQRSAALGASAHRALIRNELLNSKIDDIQTALSAEQCQWSQHSPPLPQRKVSSSFSGTLVGIVRHGAAAASRPPDESPQPVVQSAAPANSVGSPALFHFSQPSKCNSRTPTKRQRELERSPSPVSTSSENERRAGACGRHKQFCRSAPARPTPHALRAANAGSAARRNLSALYSLSPLSSDSKRLLQSPRTPARKVALQPYKTLDAPQLADDFYCDVLHWSASDQVAVGLGSQLYLWSAATAQTHALTPSDQELPHITSVQFNGTGEHLAVGTRTGLVQLWDVHASAPLRTYRAHTLVPGKTRVGRLAWSGNTLCTAGQDATMCTIDVRCPHVDTFDRFCYHSQEVCGVAFSPDGSTVASGSNDNTVCIWSTRGDKRTPLHVFDDHSAAVKAIAWHPHERGVLLTGGGTNDKSLRIRNTITMQLVHTVDTGNQVCSVLWSPDGRELVSAHGFSTNHLLLWRYPQMQQLAQLAAHARRVLYLALSPDGQSIVSGAADETLRFWKVFSAPHRRTANVCLRGGGGLRSDILSLAPGAGFN